MKYLTLENYYYKSNETYEQEYLRRYNSNESKVFNLPIKTKFNQEYNIFTMYTSEIVLLIDKIYKNIIKRKNKNMITDALKHKNFYIKNLLIEEIIATNGIEGVNSSKKDLLLASQSQNRRFFFIQNKYNKILKKEKLDINTVRDFRVIYDELMENEIDKDNLLDGNLFRKKQVLVLKADGTGKPVHKPFQSEKEIIRHLELLIEFINSEEVPELIKIAISHYYFEYIHPFYDGNGRTGRYIASSMISELDIFLAFKLSKIIKENQKEYLDAFITTIHGHNRGDATPFVIMFLNMLLKATDEIDNDIAKMEFRLERINNYIDDVIIKKYNLNKQNINVLFIIAEAKTVNLPIKIKEIADVLDVSYQTIRKQVNLLVEIGLVNNSIIYGTYELNDDVYTKMIR